MAIYKITNITNLAGKREANYNSSVDITYVDSMMKKTITIKPSETIFLQIYKLPISVQKLRVKKLVTVIEVSATELRNSMNTGKPIIQLPKAVEQSNEEEDKKSAKRKAEKKIHKEESSVNE